MPAHGNGTCVRMENAARDFGQMFRLDNLSADFLMTVAALGMTKGGSESLPRRLEFAETKARVGRSRDEDYRM